MTRKAGTRTKITVETITAAVNGGARTLTAVYEACGGKGSVPGSTARKMRGLVPDLDGRLEANRGDGSGEGRSGCRLPPRHPANPYREGSQYATMFDLATSPKRLRDGFRVDELVALGGMALT